MFIVKTLKSLDFILKPGCVGCIGKSRNYSVSNGFANAISDSVKSNVKSVEPAHLEASGMASLLGVQCTFYGSIPEFDTLKKEFNSKDILELILNLYDRNAESSHKCINIFSRINYGSYAFGIVDGDELLLARDECSLHVMDLRKNLGQIWFAPKASNFSNAIENFPEVKPYLDSKIIEFPDRHVWTFRLCDAGINVKKFKITKTKYISL